jgi:two-component system OmpR family sensor kinase
MLTNFFERLFSSQIWKVITVLLYGFLIFSFLELLVVADNAIQYSAFSSTARGTGFGSSIKEAYFNGLIAVSVFIFLAATWVSRNIKEIYSARRYRALAQLMKRFARGNTSARYSGKENDEVGQLGKTFNFLADSQNRLVSELQNYEKQRQEMVASITHDLAGPLTSISGYLKTLSLVLGAKLESEEIKYFEIIKANLNTVTKLTNELSELAKLDIDDFPIIKEIFSVRVLASDVLSRFSLEAQNKGIELTLAADSADGLIQADLNLMERVFSNLIENALRYTDAQGQIRVDIKEDRGFCHISVSDTGIGIPIQDLPFVFDRFFRVDKARSRSSGGSGLGLSISKRIVDLHGGSIEIESVEKVGTTIKVYLKLSKTDSTKI